MSDLTNQPPRLRLRSATPPSKANLSSHLAILLIVNNLYDYVNITH